MTDYSGLIILDGPDGTGKTTLANDLIKEYGAKYLHLTYRWKDRMHLYHTAALLHCLSLVNKGHLVVLDRWWPSELLYAAEFRGGSPWPHIPRLLDRLAIQYGALYILCLPYRMSTYKKRFEKLKSERKEYYNNVTNVARRYLSLFYGAPLFKQNDYAGNIVVHGGMSKRKDCLKYRIEIEGKNRFNFIEQALIQLIKLRRYLSNEQRDILMNDLREAIRK